jgi:hypothetical protein
MNDKIPNNSESAKEYLLKWMHSRKIKQQEDSQAFKREPGLYIGGLKHLPGDSIVIDNHGLPQIIREGCCE